MNSRNPGGKNEKTFFFRHKSLKTNFKEKDPLNQQDLP
jgi:hypothetical protein